MPPVAYRRVGKGSGLPCTRMYITLLGPAHENSHAGHKGSEPGCQELLSRVDQAE